MRFIVPAALIASGLAVTPAEAADQTSPLKALCEKICGGVWRLAEEPQMSDAFFTSYTYVWDEDLRGIKGLVSTVGGIGGIRRDQIVVIGYDQAAATLWSIDAEGEGKPVYGEITLMAGGYQTKAYPLGDASSSMITSIVFDGADIFTQTSEITHSGGHTISTPVRYKRVPN